MKALLEALQPGERDWELAQAIDPARMPAHIAIIMDGNGRWAGRRLMPRVAGHKAGIVPVRSTVETCARLGVKALTLYAFSVENWKRPRAEVDMLWRLLRLYLSRELPDLLRNGIRFTCMGRIDRLPAPVRQEFLQSRYLRGFTNQFRCRKHGRNIHAIRRMQSPVVVWLEGK